MKEAKETVAGFRNVTETRKRGQVRKKGNGEGS